MHSQRFTLFLVLFVMVLVRADTLGMDNSLTSSSSSSFSSSTSSSSASGASHPATSTITSDIHSPSDVGSSSSSVSNRDSSYSDHGSSSSSSGGSSSNTEASPTVSNTDETSGSNALNTSITPTRADSSDSGVSGSSGASGESHSHSADSSSEASPVYVRGVVVETSLPDGASLLAAISAATNVPRAAMAIVDGNNRPVLTRDALGADSTYRQTRVGFTTVSYYNTAFTAIQAGSVANVRFPTAAPTSAPSGLSNSDKVIIGCVVGIGVPIIILLVVIVVWFYCYRSADGYDKEHTNLEVRDAALVEFDYNNDYVNQGHATIRPRPPAMKKEEEDLL